MRPERLGEAASKFTRPLETWKVPLVISWVLARVKATVLASGLMLKAWCCARAKGVQRRGRVAARDARRVRGVIVVVCLRWLL